ncbi:MAG: hypothetical protein K9M55_00340 [Candidatus Marinimicrobia bacterium]|nr:hypothetical protein [Candidatus Neomarinimicrobiota bacterium]
MSKPKLIVPAVSFLSGLILWIVFLLWGNPQTPGMQWVGSLFCLIIAGVFYFSAVQCRIATGGRKGNRIRTIALFLMAVFTYFQSALYGAIILGIATLVIGDMARHGTDFVDADTPSPKDQG